MREYLFRGKRKDNGDWVIGNLVSTSPDEVFILIGITGHIKRDDYECYMIEVIPETVGQYTGLKDKNGKEIYEGDILREPAKNEWEAVNYAAYEVFFHDGDDAYVNIGFQMNRMHFYGSVCGGSLLMSFLPKWTKRLEIIGNIHDVNPASGQSGDNYMLDPNVKAEEATQESAAAESTAQDQAMEATQDSEEGTTEG